MLCLANLQFDEVEEIFFDTIMPQNQIKPQHYKAALVFVAWVYSGHKLLWTSCMSSFKLLETMRGKRTTAIFFPVCPLPSRNSQEDEDMLEKRTTQLSTQLSINCLYHVWKSHNAQSKCYDCVYNKNRKYGVSWKCIDKRKNQKVGLFLLHITEKVC